MTAEISTLEKAISDYEKHEKDADRFIALIDKYENFDELTITMLNEFVEKILVHERDRKGSIQTTQEVEIYFNFVGRFVPPKFAEVELTPEELEEIRKREERKDRLHQNYLKRKASGWQRQYEDRTKAKKKAEMDAKKKRSPSRGYSKGRVHSCQQYAEVRAENRTTERSLIMELNFIKCGDYYIPDIKVKNQNIRLGKWGRMRKEYLRLANPVLFSDMVLNETLYEHCAEIEETAKKRMEIIVPQLAKAYGVTEQLKAENQIEWVRQMNACVAQAEEAIKGELIYC